MKPANDANGAPTNGLHGRTLILILATAAVVYLCWLIARPFIGVATWALALAIVMLPVHERLERRMRPGVAALVTVFGVALLLIAPAVWLGRLFAQEATGMVKLLDAAFSSGDARSGLDGYPKLKGIVEWLQQRFDLEQEMRRLGGLLAGQVSGIVQGSVWILTEIVLTLVTMFFFLRDRAVILNYLRRLSPLSDQQTSAVIDRAAKTIGASLTSNLLVKVVQGFLGGLMFWFLGLPAPVLSGAAMGLLALLPILGTGLIWGPAAVILAVTGSWVKAIVLAVWGGVVVSMVDNILYPILVAGELRVYPLAVFFAVFGGLIAFGFTGIVLGPLILAITAMLIDIWSARTDPV
ncbi:MAG: AI-2E family transporter [Bryobacteraceae bacterium]